MIPYGRQQLDADDLAAVTAVLKSTWLTQGPQVPAFELAVSEHCGASYAVAVNSATSALHIACLALDVGPGDRVWTSPISFVASANCALYCGATVDFVDIDLNTANMCINALEEKLIDAKKHNTLPSVLIPVHFAGQSCDMEKIAKLAAEYNFKVIEDASHAIGARYQDKPVGSCHFSDICIFSFHPVKIITSGEGGMAITNQPLLARKMQMLRSHGITAETTEFTEESHGPWYYQQQLLGFNYRMTDMQAALGMSQSNKLMQFVAERNTLAKNFNSLFKNHKNIIPLQVQSDCYSSYHLYIIKLTGLSQAQHKKCIEELRSKGIIGHVHYIPIYLQPFYKTLGFSVNYCPNAETYYQGAVTLPLFPGLTVQQQHHIADTLLQYIESTKI